MEGFGAAGRGRGAARVMRRGGIQGAGGRESGGGGAGGRGGLPWGVAELELGEEVEGEGGEGGEGEGVEKVNGVGGEAADGRLLHFVDFLEDGFEGGGVAGLEGRRRR